LVGQIEMSVQGKAEMKICMACPTYPLQVATCGVGDYTRCLVEDVLRLLPTPQGLHLILNQALFLGLNLAVLGGLFWLLKRMWKQ
jgi:hypothetical protein